jgi:hypothetical protein
MNRAINGEQFTRKEHLAYAFCAFGLAALMIGSVVLFVCRPSNGTGTLAFFVSVVALMTLHGNREYCETLSNQDQRSE